MDDGSWVQLPSAFFTLLPELSGAETKLILLLADEQADDVWRPFGLRELARRLGYTTHTVRRAVRDLQGRGWLAVDPRRNEYGGQEENAYMITWPRIALVQVHGRTGSPPS